MSTSKAVAVAGATGFVGRYVVAELIARGHTVRALVSDRTSAGALPRAGVTRITGNPQDSAAVAEFLSGASACVNLVGILREFRAPGVARTFRDSHQGVTRNLVQGCEAAGVTRFVQLSAIGVRANGVSEYQSSKWEAEQIVRRSSLDWTIFRAALIHGPESEFVKVVTGWLGGHKAPWVFLPYFVGVTEDTRVPLGSVTHVDPTVAPVSVQDVARAVVASLANDAAVGEVYNLCGSETLSWPEMLRHMRDHVPGANGELEPHGIPAPLAACKAMIASRLGLGAFLPFDEGMARMGAENSTASLDKFKADFGFTPAPFRESFETYAETLGVH